MKNILIVQLRELDWYITLSLLQYLKKFNVVIRLFSVNIRDNEIECIVFDDIRRYIESSDINVWTSSQDFLSFGNGRTKKECEKSFVFVHTPDDAIDDGRGIIKIVTTSPLLKFEKSKMFFPIYEVLPRTISKNDTSLKIGIVCENDIFMYAQHLEALLTLKKIQGINFVVIARSGINIEHFSYQYPYLEYKLCNTDREFIETLDTEVPSFDYVVTLFHRSSVYHAERLSMILPLAIAYNVPLITDKRIYELYKDILPNTTVSYDYDAIDRNNIDDIINVFKNLNCATNCTNTTSCTTNYDNENIFEL